MWEGRRGEESGEKGGIRPNFSVHVQDLAIKDIPCIGVDVYSEAGVYTYQSDVSTVHKQGKLLHSLCKPWLKASVFVHITRTHLENVFLILSLTTNRRAPQKRVSKASCQQWVRETGWSAKLDTSGLPLGSLIQVTGSHYGISCPTETYKEGSKGWRRMWGRVVCNTMRSLDPER